MGDRKATPINIVLAFDKGLRPAFLACSMLITWHGRNEPRRIDLDCCGIVGDD